MDDFSVSCASVGDVLRRDKHEEGDTPQRLSDRALILLLSTGCRISEALALNRQDVMGDHTVVRGKGNKERSVELTERTRGSLV